MVMMNPLLTETNNNRQEESGEENNWMESSAVQDVTKESYLFSEHQEALHWIECLSSSSSAAAAGEPCSNSSQALRRLREIFDKYLECPTLLDPHLEELVNRLASGIVAALVACRTAEDYLALFRNDTNGAAAVAVVVRYHFSALYSLCKVRGRKCIQRFLPHRVEDMEPVWKGLQAAIQTTTNKGDTTNNTIIDATTTTLEHASPLPPLWESTYVLWIWMAGLSLVPFDCRVVLCRGVDDTASTNRNDKTAAALWMTDFVHTCRLQLSNVGPIRTVAADCLAHWLSRPDFEEQSQLATFVSLTRKQLREYMTMGSTTTTTSTDDPEGRRDIALLGLLQTLTTILKVSTMDRQKLCVTMQPLWETVLELTNQSQTSNNKKCKNRIAGTSSTLLQKLLVKWWTRMSCVFLPPRVAAWRNQRGQRSLFGSLASSKGTEIVVNTECNNDTNKNCDDSNDDDMFLVPDEVEDAMGRALETLSHTSTVVRWSAAKGVGRITERLPSLCADDVLDAVLELFVGNDDTCWHGACLALAELARRGALPPHRLGDVVPWIVRAAHYECGRRDGPIATNTTSSSSVGAHVRDAACYTYWACARAYKPEILRPYIAELSEAILLTSLFDREVNCRRAASAAFQEAVGRQGATNFPNGIAIVTTADYFSLGNRSESYLTIAVKIAKFENHRRPMICHLYESKLFHWDKTIRLLASRCLRQIVILDLEFVTGVVIPSLLEKCLDEKDLNVRHGAVVGMAEILGALSEIDHVQCISRGNQLLIQSLVSDIEKKRLYRGRGGELMRSGVCRLVECMCSARLPLSVKEQVRLLDSIDGHLPHPTEAIQLDACRALEALMTFYFPVGEGGPSERLQKRVVDKFVCQVRSSENPAITRGYALALGYLPAKLLSPNKEVLGHVLECLQDTAKHTAVVGGESDAETRRNALQSMIRITRLIAFTPSCKSSIMGIYIDASLFSNLINSYCEALNDYRSDKRGDVGSWCRLQGIKGLTETILSVATSDDAKSYSFIADGVVERFVGSLLRLLAEPLDTIRQSAGESLLTLLQVDSPGFHIPERERLSRTADICKQQWSDPISVFPALLDIASLGVLCYFENVIAGFVTSVGGLTGHAHIHASDSLLLWAKQGKDDRRMKLGEALLTLLDENAGSVRLVVPILKTLDLLFDHGCLDNVTKSSPNFALDCQRTVQREMSTKDVPRLLAIVDVSVAIFSASSGDETIERRTFGFLCKILAHPFPRVRSYAAEQLYLLLLEYDGGKCTETLEFVLSTPWKSESFDKMRHYPSKIAEQLDVLTEFTNEI